MLLFLTLLSPGKVVADYLGLQFRRLLGRSDKTLESVLQIRKPSINSFPGITMGEERKETIPLPLAKLPDEVTFHFILTLYLGMPRWGTAIYL